MTKYIEKERAKYWPISRKLMAQYKDGSHTEKDRNGNLIWKQNGLLHRDGDKSAYIGCEGTSVWYQNGSIHRNGDKPAFIDADGTLQWRQNGQLHRFGGPAVIYPNSKREWYWRGEEITQEVDEWLNGEEWKGTPEQIVEFQLRFT